MERAVGDGAIEEYSGEITVGAGTNDNGDTLIVGSICC